MDHCAFDFAPLHSALDLTVKGSIQCRLHCTSTVRVDALVASSSSKTPGFRISARAIAMLWRCPPLNATPRDPHGVARPVAMTR